MSGRKIISVLVTCIFVLSSFSAACAAGEIGWRDTRLDAVFSSGQVRMREVQLAGIQLTAEDLVLPAEYQAALSENAAEVTDWLASLYVLSVSPSGNSALLTDGQMLIAWNNGKARIVQPNLSRGVEDTYGNFQKIWSQPISALFRASGNDIAWSPDGRYASVTNSRSVLTMMRLENDPHLIDMETGDVFLLAAFNTKPLKGNAAAPVAVCFSRDGQYVYYMLYGNISSRRTALLRYDLEAKHTEICCSVSDGDYYPRLWELQDGSLLIIQDVDPKYKTTMEHPSLARYTQTGSGWMRFEQKLPLEAVNAYTNHLEYSDASGYALVNIRVRFQSEVAFQCFRPDRDYAGLDNYWAFETGTGKAVRLTAEEIRNLNTVTEGSDDPLNAYEIIINEVLSPDGRYAVFHTSSKNDEKTARHLRLVRLSDMSAIEVRGIDPEALEVLPADRNAIEWNSDAVLILLRSGVKSFMIE